MMEHQEVVAGHEQAVAPRQSTLELAVQCAPKVNLADFQNAVPLLNGLSAINHSATDLHAVSIQLRAEPAFIKPRTWLLDVLAAGQTHAMANLDVEMDAALLGRLTEAETATLTISMVCDTLAEPDWAQAVCPVELLPRNHWAGLSQMPDMVAAFVQPNDPAIDRLLKATAEVLRKHGKNAALDGYTGGAKRAWELSSALWSAVAALNIDYAYPPASFEHQGQKVRSPSQILDTRIATCLDLTLLFAAALEQLGLHPLVVFTKGHAFVGAWLKNETFSAVVVDDITALRKRVQLNELLLFETTMVTHEPCPSFTLSTHQGASQIAEDKSEAFELAVDIRRARLQRIKPLASAQAVAPVATDTAPAPQEPSFDEAPDLSDETIAEPGPESLSPADRLMRWQRKLLDLSLRNNLLNFRAGKKALSLDAPNPGALEDLLASGQAIKLLCRPDLMDGADPRNQAIYEQRNQEDVRREHALDALKRQEVFVRVEDKELEARLVDLYRTARLTLQEGGANTLYLALGFLNWTQAAGGQTHKAPLILIPVTLNRKSVRSGFTLTLHDDEPKFNPTLIEMLRQDFRLNLGVVDGQLARDDSGLDVVAIWRTVSHAVRDIAGWEVSQDVVLSVFSFAKYLMWKDLSERTDQLRQNPVVRHLIDTPRDNYPSGVPFPDPRRLDEEYTPQQTFCPLPADSSQLSAVMAVAKGKDFVLIGPPGTGKSQTIANLIAQCLAEKKRVLFVSEKIAALDVVYRRLREVGLGDFCLELHSSKARKADVLLQLQTSWDAQGGIDAAEWRTQAETLKRHRDKLNEYVQRLHLPQANGMTIYSAMGVVIGGDDAPVVALSWPSPTAHTRTQLDDMRQVVERLCVNAVAVGKPHLHQGPFAAIRVSQWSPSWQQTLVGAAKNTATAAEHVQVAADQLLAAAQLPIVVLTRRARAALASLVRALPAAHGQDWRFVLRADAADLIRRMKEGLVLVEQHRALNAHLSPLWSDTVTAQCAQGLHLLGQYRQLQAGLLQPWPLSVVDELEKGLALLQTLDNTAAQLSVPYGDAVDALNVHQLARAWHKAEKAIWPMAWWGKRAITQTLEATAIGEGMPNVGQDLHLHVKLRDLKSQVSKLTMDPMTASVWVGLATQPAVVQAALRFQQALRAAHQHGPWSDDNLDAVAQGRCGTDSAKALERMRTMQKLTTELNTLDALRAATSALWAGHDTQMDALKAALAFLAARTRATDSGELPGTHPEVAAGQCGAAMAADLARLNKRTVLEDQLRASADLQTATGGVWQGLATQYTDVARVEKFHASLAAALGNLDTDSDKLAAWNSALGALLGQGNALLSPLGAVVQAGQTYTAAWSNLRPALEQISAVGAFSEGAASEFSDLPIPEIIQNCQGIIGSENRLNAWCAWRKVRDEAVAMGLTPVVEATETGHIQPTQLRRTFEVNYGRWWLNAVVDQEPVIRSFVTAEHEKRIADFRALDTRFTQLTRDWVRASLCAGLPAKEDVSRHSEWGILRHEISKKKRHMPLRELIKSTPNVLTQLTPCLLMSPLSIAQFLPAESQAFDVVVFDEASQITVWDAIGAIARGKQVVMVGDPKQLPPTRFFDRAESGLDDEDVESDLESILDECMGANLPTINLSWHYRSRHESLIAFSNHRYYGGGLVTFPSPVAQDQAVSFHPVSGVYAKGGARTNPIEAKALVADVVARLRSPAFKASGHTIGIVTFNTEQMGLIEDLLDEERRKDPSLEPHFAETALEPLFVKNLESVQGDERDTMYFSITYGPDLGGAVSMNFGPMNRDGGERRLNVAITRARHELRVFSSLKAEQFDLARTQAKGVRDLKHFLEFAEHGTRALAAATQGSLGGFESPFEAAVATALAAKGWEVQTQIGASSFRIDLAVLHPDARGTYLAGVECDGATYHRSATARDRDMLREQVLRGLGWEILRVWSTDWWIDSAGTLDKLHASLENRLSHSRATRQQEAEQAMNTGGDVAANATTEAPMPATVSHRAAQGGPLEAEPQQSAGDPAPPPDQPELIRGNAPNAPSRVQAERFEEANPASVAPDLSPTAFYETTYGPVLRRMVEHVVSTEGPVLDDVLARRIARAHGWSRTGAQIKGRVMAIAEQVSRLTHEDVGVFFWPPSLGESDSVPFRLPAVGMARAVDEMCPQELLSLARSVAGRGLSGDDAVLAMTHALGLRHIRGLNKDRLLQALAACQPNGS